MTLLGDETTRARYRRTYKLLGYAMVAFPILSFFLISRMPLSKSAIFFVELAGIYVFATYWVVKSSEVAKTNSDERAAHGKLRVKPHGLSDALRPVPVAPVGEQNPEQSGSVEIPAAV